MNKSRIALMMVMVVSFVVVISVSAQGPSSYTTGFQVANLDAANEAAIVIEFFRADGSTEATIIDTIPAGDSNSYYPLTAVSAGFAGSAVISSDREVAAIVNVLGTKGGTVGDFGGADYSGISDGSEIVYIPQVMRDFYGINSWFNVQNAGSSATTVTVFYSGNLGSCNESAVTIQPGAAATFNQSTSPASCMLAGFLGAARVEAESGGSIVTAVVQYDSKSLLAYNGFSSSGDPDIFAPFVSHRWYGSRTALQIQNTGTTDTNVTVTYSPSPGFPGKECSQTLTVPAGGSSNFGDSTWFEQPSNVCGPMSGGSQSGYGFVGSAKTTANTNSQNLVAIVNTVTTGTPNGATYNAFNPSSATSKVTFPQVMDTYFGIFTGSSVVNAGTQATDIVCDFTGSYPSASLTNVQPGEALTATQLGIQANYLGAATCTATGGDAKIVGIVSQLGGVAGSDLLLYYEGANH